MPMSLEQLRAAAGGLDSFTDEELAQASYQAFQRFYPDANQFYQAIGYDPGDNFARGFKMAGRNTLAALGGAGALAADAFGAEGVRGSALQYAQEQGQLARNMGRRSDDVDNFMEDPGAFLAGGLGQAAGYALPSLLPGVGATGVAARAGLGLAGRTAAAGAGAYAGNLAQESGGIYNELTEQGQYEPGRALAYGAGAAALDTAPEMLGIGRLAKGSAGGLGRRVFGGAVKGAAAEIPTEIAQTAIERAGAYKPIDDAEAMHEYRNAAALGGLGGGAFGAITGLPRQRSVDAEPDLLQGETHPAAGQQNLYGFAPEADPNLVPQEFELQPPVFPGANQPTEQMGLGFGAEELSGFDPRQGELFGSRGQQVSQDFDNSPFVPEFGTSPGVAAPTQGGLDFGAPSAPQSGGLRLAADGSQLDFIDGGFVSPNEPPAPPAPNSPTQDTQTGDMFNQTPSAMVGAGNAYTPNTISSKIAQMTGVRRDGFVTKLSVALSRSIGNNNAAANLIAQTQAELEKSLAKIDKQVSGDSNKLTPEQYAEKRGIIEQRQLALEAASQIVGEHNKALTNAFADEARARGGKPTQTGAAPAPSTATEQSMREKNAVAQTRAATADTDVRVQGSDKARAKDERASILKGVLDDPTTKNPVGRFTAALKKAGITDASLTAEEADTVSRFMDAREAFNATEEVPSAPNELDPYEKPKGAKGAPAKDSPKGVPAGRPADTAAGAGDQRVVQGEQPNTGRPGATGAPAPSPVVRERAVDSGGVDDQALKPKAAPAPAPGSVTKAEVQQAKKPRGNTRLHTEYEAAVESLAAIKRQIKNARLTPGSRAARAQQEAYVEAELAVEAARRAVERSETRPAAPKAPVEQSSAAPGVTLSSLKPRLKAAQKGLQDALNNSKANVEFKRTAFQTWEAIKDAAERKNVKVLLDELQDAEDLLAQDAGDFQKDSLKDRRSPERVRSEQQFALDTAGMNAVQMAEHIGKTSKNVLRRMIARRVASRLQSLAEAGYETELKVGGRDDALLNRENGTRGVVAIRVKNGKPRAEVTLASADRTHSGMNEETALHELIHAATSMTLRGLRYGDVNSVASGAVKTASEDLQRLRDAVVQHTLQASVNGKELPAIIQSWMAGKSNVLDNVDEMLAWGLTNGQVQAFLKTVPYKSGKVWSRWADALRRLLGLPSSTENAFAELIRVNEELMTTPPEDTVRMAEKAKEAGRLKETDGDRQRDEFTMPEPNEVGQMAHTLNTVKGWLGDWRNRPGSLGWLTLRQIEDRFPFVKPYAAAMRKMGDTAKALANEVNKVINPWRNLPLDVQKRLGSVMLEATMLQAHVDRTWEENQHLHSPDEFQNAENKREFERVKSLYNALTPRAKEVYQAARDNGRMMWERQTQAMAEAIKQQQREALSGYFTDAQLSEIVRSPLKMREQIKADLKAAPLPATVRRALRDMIEAAEHNYREGAQLQGPYFPLQRNGDHVVVAKSGALKTAQERFVQARDALQKLYDADPPADDKEATAFDKSLEDARAEVSKAKNALELLKSKDQHYAVSFFEHRWEAEAYSKQLGQDANVQKHGLDVRVEQRAQHYKVFDSASPQFMKQLRERLQQSLPKADVAAVDRAVREVYMRSMPDRSALKGELRRLNVPGAKATEMMRGFASRGLSNAYRISRLENGGAIQDALTALRRSEDRDELIVGDELAKRMLKAMDPPKPNSVVAGMAQVSQLTFLGLSPSYVLMNATQPWVVSLPIMAARHGWAASAKALGDASVEVAKLVKVARDSERDELKKDGVSGLKASVLSWRFDLQPEKLGKTDAERTMLRTLFNDGLIDITIEHDLGAVATGANKNVLDLASEFASTPAHVAEIINRVATALAAFRLQQGKDVNERNAEASTAYAMKIVADTHFDYSAENAPRLMRPDSLGGLGRLVFQFKKFTQSMIYLNFKLGMDALRGDKESAKAFTRLWGMTIAVAGTTGLPIAGALGLMAKAIAQLWDDDDEPDFYQELYNGAKDAVGETAARAVFKGLPAAVGADLSQRLGQGSLLNPFQYADSNKDGRDAFASMLVSMGGPSAAVMANWFDAASVASTDPKRAWELVLPRAFSDPLKALNRSDRGVVSRAGDTLVAPEEIGALQNMLRSLGIESTDVTDMYESRGAVAAAKAETADVRGALIRRYIEAKESGDVGDVQQQINEFNRRNPKNLILPKTIRQSEKAGAQRQGRGPLGLGKRDVDVLDQVGLE